MAKFELVEYEGRTVRQYESGLLMGLDGKLIKPAPHTLVDSSSSSALHGRKLEKKRAAVMDAANSAVADSQFHKFGSLAFVGAIAASAMRKAQDSKDAKSIEAARFLLAESGLSDSVPDVGESGLPERVSSKVLVILAELSRRRAGPGVDQERIIEGSINA